MYFKIYISAGIWGTAWVILVILLANAGLTAFGYWFQKKNLKYNNEVAGIIFGVLTLIYSLIIAFVIVAVWENYEELNHTIEKEVDNLNSVLIHGNMLPDSLKQSVSVVIKSYCQKVVNEEWDMSENQERYKVSVLPSLRLLLFQVETDSKIQENLLSIMDNNLDNLNNLHRERLSHTRSYVPELVWMVLVIGSIMVILFSYFLYMESLQLKRIFLSFLWAMIAMCLFLVYMLDHPFYGTTQVSKASYEGIIKTLSGG